MRMNLCFDYLCYLCQQLDIHSWTLDSVSLSLSPSLFFVISKGECPYFDEFITTSINTG